MKGKKIPCVFYFYLHSRLQKQFGWGNTRLKEAKHYLGRWGIPYRFSDLVIKELEILGLLTRKNRNTIRIRKRKLDDKTINNFYRELGLF